MTAKAITNNKNILAEIFVAAMDQYGDESELPGTIGFLNTSGQIVYWLRDTFPYFDGE